MLGEISELGHEPRQWRVHAVEQLIPLLRAQVGLTMDVQVAPDRPSAPIEPIDIGWTQASARTVYLQYYKEEIARDPGAIAVMAAHRKARFVSATRHQLVDDATWYRSRAVSEMRRAADVDDFVHSSVQWSPDSVQGFAFYRPWRAQPFEVHQRTLLRLFHVGLLRQYKLARAKQKLAQEHAQLSPRLQQTLELLRSGASVKQAAGWLGLSVHTVTEYNKVLHRKFGVNTRAELVRACETAQSRPTLRMPAVLERSAVVNPAG